MFQIIGEVDGVEVLNRAFNRTDGFISDLRNFAPALSEEFYKAEAEQFESEGSKGASGKWAALSPTYKKFKDKHFPGAKILQRERVLKESLTSSDALDSIYQVSKDEIVWGSRAPYAVAHQRGTARFPARPPISLSEPQKRNIQKAAQRVLVEFTRKAGFEVEEIAA